MHFCELILQTRQRCTKWGTTSGTQRVVRAGEWPGRPTVPGNTSLQLQESWRCGTFNIIQKPPTRSHGIWAVLSTRLSNVRNILWEEYVIPSWWLFFLSFYKVYHQWAEAAIIISINHLNNNYSLTDLPKSRRKHSCHWLLPLRK